ncbi:hypothetical protein BVG81_009600, partial [Haliangium sp. UPWRP_2]
MRALSGSSQDELRRRLSEWLRLHNSKRGRGAAEGECLPGTEPIELRQLSLLLAELASLPAHGSIRQHIQALSRLCERFALGQRAMGSAELLTSEGDSEPTSMTEAERAVDAASALARDQAAVAVLRRVLHLLPLAAETLRLGEQGLSRPQFAALLRALCQRLFADVQRQPTPSASVGEVQLGGLFELPVQPRRGLFFLGLIEGEMPASAAEDPLLSDDERALCNRLFGGAILPLSRSVAEAAPLRFVELLAHAQTAQLSYSRADEEGRPLLPSSFIAAAWQASGREGPVDESSAPPATPAERNLSAAEARHPSELWRFAASALVGNVSVGGLPAAVALALGRRERDRRLRLLSRLEVERARAAWFLTLSTAGEGANQPFDMPAGAYSGQLSDRRIVAELASRLPGDARRPLSASALEDYARCPYRYFVYRVLHAGPIEEGSDDLDPLTSGRLHHR